jgi:TetR/AcrR family transcriptional regulator, lmrAB and yxaGH operons repressor
MALASLTKQEVVARLLETFREDGFEGASLAELSKRTGLGKSSLYHYFPGGKEDMASSVLDSVDGWLEEQQAALLKSSSSPVHQLDSFFAAISEFYAQGRKACLLASFSTSASRRVFQDRLKRSFELWLTTLSALLVQLGFAKARAAHLALDALIRIEGALVVSAGLNAPEVFAKTLEQTRRDLLEQRSTLSRNR